MEGQSCPVEARTVDGSAGRITSLLVAVLLVTALFAPAKWVLILVLVDYLLRDVAGPGKSPLCWLGRRVARVLGLPVRPVNAAPKRFAAWLATAFVAVGVLAHYALSASLLAAVSVGVFATCALLDGALGFCVGCRVYAALQWSRQRIGGGPRRHQKAPVPRVADPRAASCDEAA